MNFLMINYLITQPQLPQRKMGWGNSIDLLEASHSQTDLRKQKTASRRLCENLNESAKKGRIDNDAAFFHELHSG